MPPRGSSSWRRVTYGAPCTPDLEPVRLGPVCTVRVHAPTVDAFAVLGAILTRHGYDIHEAYPEGDTGSYNCRPIAGSGVWSSHAYGLAVDINWNSNPQRSPLTTDLPMDAVAQIEALRTKGGAPVFRWGGRFSTPDPMHFEVIATPDELEAGLSQRPDDEEDTMRHGDRGPDVAAWQLRLAQWWFRGDAAGDDELQAFLDDGPDGGFGDNTDYATRKMQRQAGLKVDGVVGAAEWTIILAHREDRRGSGGSAGAHDHDDEYAARDHGHPHDHEVSGRTERSG